MALGTIPAAITGLGTAANAAVTVGTNISAFPDRDMVVAVGYDLGQELLIEVLRNDVVIGSTRGPALDTPEGVGLEVNHGVEGTPKPGECWNGYTPDLVGGDLIRVTPAGSAVSDTMTVTDQTFDGGPFLEPDGNVSVKGTATPGTDFAVEFRRDKPDPRFRGEARPPVFEGTTNAWKATYRVVEGTVGLTADEQRDILLNEASWAAVAGGEGTENTLAELGEPAGVAAGCPGSADPNTLVGGLDPINVASGDVTFSGTARAGVAAVSVKVGTLAAKDATVVANGTNPSTWTLKVPKTELATIPDGSVTVTPTFDTLVGASRTILKDTVAPLAPSPSVAPGTYAGPQSVVLNKPAGEGTSKVYWEIGNSAVPDPTDFSNLYTTQISITSNQTLKGRLYDAAGNPGAVGTFDYRIGTPPPAPTGLAGSESTTAAGTAVLRWNPASGATGYHVYRDDVKVTTTPLAATSFTDAAGLGDHSYVVRAVEGNGIESLDSNRVTVTVAAPAVPTNLQATGGDRRVSLSWTAVSGASSYRVYRDGVVIAPAVSGATYVDTGVVNDTLYEYAVTSRDAGGNESARSGIAQAIPTPPPADTTAPPAPSVIPASGSYTGAQTVTATNAESGVTHRYTVGTGTTVPADPTATSAVLPAGGLPVDASSVVKIRSFDAADNGSTTVTRTYTITTTPPPGGTRTETVNASADTMVHQGRATTTHGGATTLNVDSQYTTGNASTRTSAYLRFTVPALAAGETITGAALSLNITNATPNGPVLYRTSTTWNEGTMTWSSGQPARLDNTADGNFGNIATGRHSTPVTGITGPGTVSFQVYAEDVDGAQFSSRETTSDPQLVLTIRTP